MSHRVGANGCFCVLTGGARYVPGASDGRSGFGADPFTGKPFPPQASSPQEILLSRHVPPPHRLRSLHPRIGSRPQRSSGRGRPIHR